MRADLALTFLWRSGKKPTMARIASQAELYSSAPSVLFADSLVRAMSVPVFLNKLFGSIFTQSLHSLKLTSASMEVSEQSRAALELVRLSRKFARKLLRKARRLKLHKRKRRMRYEDDVCAEKKARKRYFASIGY